MNRGNPSVAEPKGEKRRNESRVRGKQRPISTLASGKLLSAVRGYIESEIELERAT